MYCTCIWRSRGWRMEIRRGERVRVNELGINWGAGWAGISLITRRAEGTFDDIWQHSDRRAARDGLTLLSVLLEYFFTWDVKTHLLLTYFPSTASTTFSYTTTLIHTNTSHTEISQWQPLLLSTIWSLSTLRVRSMAFPSSKARSSWLSTSPASNTPLPLPIQCVGF